jgi:hypothetical protein
MANILALFEFRAGIFRSCTRFQLGHPLRWQSDLSIGPLVEAAWTAGTLTHEFLSEPSICEAWYWMHFFSRLETRLAQLHDRLFQHCVDTHREINNIALQYKVADAVVVALIDASHAKLDRDADILTLSQDLLQTLYTTTDIDALLLVQELKRAFNDKNIVDVLHSIRRFNENINRRVDDVAMGCADYKVTDEFIRQATKPIEVWLAPDLHLRLLQELLPPVALSFAYRDHDVRKHLVEVLFDEHKLPHFAVYRTALDDDCADVIPSDFDAVPF